MADLDHHPAPTGAPGRPMSRRRFVGYLIAAPTLAAGAQLGLGAFEQAARAVIPSGPEPADLYDLTDLLTDATIPTANLITVVLNSDGTASFALPRAEVGQGITTAVAMTIADELSMPLSAVEITLADARPELIWNQLTGGSNSMHSIFTPVRVAAALAKNQLVNAAAAQLGAAASTLTARDGVVTARDGRRLAYGALARTAAVRRTKAVPVALNSTSSFTLVGTPQNRIDALDIVTGR